MTAEEIARLERTVNERWDMFLEQVWKPFVAGNAKDHGSILEQTTKTNSNVKDLQLWRARFEGAFFTGRVIWAVLGVGLAIFGMLVKIQWGG